MLISNRKAAGFTLIELMFAIAVLGIVVAIGVPSFTTMIQNNQMVTAVNDLNGTLQYARAEAVRRGGSVRVSSVDSDVGNGLRIWFDENGDNGFDADDDLELRLLDIDPATLALGADVGGTDTPDLDFSFNARGETTLGNTLTLGLCDDREGNHGRQLELLISGAVRLRRDVACTSAE